MRKNKNNQAIWNTRIKKNTSSIFQKVGSSLNIDKRLFKEDVSVSIAHVDTPISQWSNWIIDRYAMVVRWRIKLKFKGILCPKNHFLIFHLLKEIKNPEKQVLTM